ncbi:MAG: hypothetical protein ACI837_003336 [Crocinitomicaceae bacterium]|jgi:hypothetical protein
MKKLLLPLFTLLLSITFSNQVSAQEAIQLDGAEISFGKEIHDYGNVKYGSEGICMFEFTNTGNAPLIISDAKKSCGCTVPSWPKEPIAPGATGTIKVQYDMKRPGAINKAITIVSNSVSNPSKVIRIKGNVEPKPTTSPVIKSVGPEN